MVYGIVPFASICFGGEYPPSRETIVYTYLEFGILDRTHDDWNSLPCCCQPSLVQEIGVFWERTQWLAALYDFLHPSGLVKVWNHSTTDMLQNDAHHNDVIQQTLLQKFHYWNGYSDVEKSITYLVWSQDAFVWVFHCCRDVEKNQTCFKRFIYFLDVCWFCQGPAWRLLQWVRRGSGGFRNCLTSPVLKLQLRVLRLSALRKASKAASGVGCAFVRMAS